MDAPAMFRMAEGEMAEGELDNAIRTLDRLLLAYGDWERVPEARLMLGNAYAAKEEYLTAATEYRRFLDRYPGHPGAADAALGRCRSYAALSPQPERDQTYTQDALRECSNAALDFAGTPQAEEATEIAREMRTKLAEKDYLNGEFYFRRDLHDSAIMYFEFVIQRYPDTEYAPLALLGIYEANMEIGYEDLAAEARDRLLAEYPDSPAADEVRANGSRA
jgi:outer membrane protein assembly factor BamD